MGEEEKVPNPGAYFEDAEDPNEYMQAYDKLKSDIRKIEQNGRAIQKLSERYNSSTEKQQNTGLAFSPYSNLRKCANATPTNSQQP